MTTTTTPSNGDTFHRTNAATTGYGDAPQSSSCLQPEWMPLDGIAQTWAAFGAEATSPAAFQATGTAFLALAFESTALRHYASSVSATGGENSLSLAYTQSIEHTMADLNEAHQQWKSVLLWLDLLARETSTSVERLSSLVLEQLQRVLSLIVRVQQEYLDAHHEPLLIYLGYLPAPAAKKAGQP